MTRTAHARARGLVLAVATVTLVVAGCSATEPSPDVPTNQQPVPSTGASTEPSAEPGPTSDPQDVPSPTASASSAPDPEAPRTFSKVERPGRDGGKQVRVRSTTRDRVTWADGVTLRVTSVTSSTASGRGPGSVNGAPLSTVDLTVRNGSSDGLDLSRVVLSVPYGTGTRLLARQVYTDEATDFSGTVAAGGSARATYAFSVPVKQRATASLVVDLDDAHALATLDRVLR